MTDTQTEAPADPTKRCVHCASVIALGASVCPICKLYQARYRNWLVFGATGAGFITLLASGILFSIDKIIYIYNEWNWSTKVYVEYFHSFTHNHHAITLLNSGSGPVLVREITIYYGPAYNSHFPINKTIAKGDFLSIPVSDKPSEYRGLTRYARNKDGNPSKEMFEGGTADWEYGKQCYAIFFIDAESEDINRMDRAYAAEHNKLITTKVDARVIYFDQKTGERFNQPFSAVATYLLSDDPGCAKRAGSP